MPCLAHNKRFSSCLHAIANELRKEERVPISIIRSLPRQCCTCQDNESDTIDLVPMNENDDDYQWMKVQNVRERINKIEPKDNHLIRSFNRLEKIIREYRAEIPMVTAEPNLIETNRKFRNRQRKNERSSSTSSLSDMESEKSESKKKEAKKNGHPKKIKQGTFVFLPFTRKTTNKRNSGKGDSLLAVALSQQLKRFLGQKAHFGLLEKQFKMKIHVITPQTSPHINQALEDAKLGMTKLTIHNNKDALSASETEPGVWVLIRPKSAKVVEDMNNVLEEITKRWSSCLTIEKRGFITDESDTDADQNDVQRKPKSTFKAKRR